MIELTQDDLKERLNAPIFHHISETADELGLECYVVGGYVRDLFLQRPSKDIDVVVVGSGITIAEALGKKLGKGAHVSVFRNQAKSFLVIGILAERDESLGASYNSTLFMPYNTYVQRFRRTDQVGTYVVKVAEGYDATAVADDIEGYLDEIAGFDYYRLFSPATVKEMSDSVMSTFSMFLAAIAAISLVVGGIGIMNIMLVSVVERTGEIGIRKALGASPKAIRMQFLVESVTLSLSGGLIGLAAGTALSFAAVSLAGWSLHISLGAIAVSLLFSLFIGVFFGWYPAAKAARLQPMEALSRD